MGPVWVLGGCIVKKLIVVLVALFVLQPAVVRAQWSGPYPDHVVVELPPPVDGQGSSAVDLVSQTCARGRVQDPWRFIAVGSFAWLRFDFEPTVFEGCPMNVVFETHDPDVIRFVWLQFPEGFVDCAGSSQVRVQCTAPAGGGDLWVRVEYEAVGAGVTSVEVRESGSAFHRLYEFYVSPDFLWFLPLIRRTN